MKILTKYSLINLAIALAGSLLFSGCDNVSSLDGKRITSTSLIGAEISLTSNAESDYLSKDYREHNRIKVTLFDSKNIDIKNSSLRVFMNGLEMPLLSEMRLLNDERPYYYLKERILPDKPYCFTLVLSDSSVHTLATIFTQNQITFKQFNFPEVYSRKNDLFLAWQKIEPPARLYVYRSSYPAQNKDSASATFEDRSSPGIIKKEIGKRTFLGLPWFRARHYTIPASFFTMENRVVSGLTFDIESTQEGKVWEGFLKNSRISATYGLKKTIQLRD